MSEKVSNLKCLPTICPIALTTNMSLSHFRMMLEPEYLTCWEIQSFTAYTGLAWYYHCICINRRVSGTLVTEGKMNLPIHHLVRKKTTQFMPLFLQV